MGKNGRKLRNYLITPGFQLKFTVYFAAFGIGITGTMAAAILFRVNQIRTTLNNSQDVSYAIQTLIDSLFFEVLSISLITIVLFGLFSFFYSVIISHRIAGPIIAICRFIDDIKDGNYRQRSLRKYDELQLIMDNLNSLAESLETESASVKRDTIS